MKFFPVNLLTSYLINIREQRFQKEKCRKQENYKRGILIAWVDHLRGIKVLFYFIFS